MLNTAFTFVNYAIKVFIYKISYKLLINNNLKHHL